MQSVRSMINNVPKDFKDHVFLTVVYLFVVVQWLSLSVSSTAGIIAIAVGFVGAIIWEIANVKIEKNPFILRNAVRDILAYVIPASLYLMQLV